MQNNNCFTACILSEDIAPKDANSLFAEVGKKKKKNIFIYKTQIDMLFLDIQ